MALVRINLFATSVLSALLLNAASAWAADRLVFGVQIAYGLENAIPRNISHINMFYAQPQIGIALWDSSQTHLPIRRFEILSEGILGGSPHPGGRMIGDTLLFRFVFRPVGRSVPLV